jgi:hypothetical protein
MAIPAWLTIISWIFISIGLLSAALILADIYLLGYREDVTIMEAVWPLTALYAGPIALAAYAAWGRPTSPRWLKPRGRGGLSKPFWAGTAVSATHCGAGCVLGDLIAEWTVFAVGLQLAGFALRWNTPSTTSSRSAGESCSSTTSSSRCATCPSARASSAPPRPTSWP